MPAVVTGRRTYQVGELRFSAIVAGQGPLVLCLHGFPDNNQSFRHQIPALVAAGYQVVCPLLPGYEESSQNRAGHYDMETLADTLAALIRAIQHQHGIQEPVHLIGHDWGAIAGYALCVRQPGLIRSFAALTIPYNLTLGGVLRQARGQWLYSWYIQFFQLRHVAERALEFQDWALVEQLIRLWSPTWSMPSETRRSIKHTLAQPGVKEAALGYYRAIFGLARRERRARALMNACIQVPTLQLRGEQDGCIHPDLWLLTRAESFTGGLTQQRVAAGHFLHQERPGEVNEILLDWLEKW